MVGFLNPCWISKQIGNVSEEEAKRDWILVLDGLDEPCQKKHWLPALWRIVPQTPTVITQTR